MIRLTSKEILRQKAWWDVLVKLHVNIVKNPQILHDSVKYTVNIRVKLKIFSIIETTKTNIYNYLFTCIE
jgi:hypothetical protein